MALLQGTVSRPWQTVFGAAFAVYAATLLVERTGSAVTNRPPSAMFCKLRAVLLVATSFMYVYAMSKTATSKTRFAQSAAVSVLLALMLGLQAAAQGAPASDQEAATHKFSHLSVVAAAAVLFFGLTATLWGAAAPQQALLLVPLLAVLAYSGWAASAIYGSSTQLLDLNRATVVSPLVQLSLLVIVFFVLAGFRPLFNGDDIKRYTDATWQLGLYGALVLVVSWLGSCISSAQQAVKRLMAAKLVGLQNYLRRYDQQAFETVASDGRTAGQAIQAAASSAVSVKTTSVATGAALAAQLGPGVKAIADAAGLDLVAYLSSGNGAVDPAGGADPTSSVAPSIMACVAVSSFVAATTYLLFKAGPFVRNPLSSVVVLAVAALAGWCGYSTTLLRDYAVQRGALYCSDNGLSPQQCAASGMQVAWVTSAVQQIKGGDPTQPVTVDTGNGVKVDLFPRRLPASMSATYAALDSLPGLVDEYLQAYTTLANIAARTDLDAFLAASPMLAPAAGDDVVVAPGRTLGSYALRDVVGILGDADGWSQSLAPSGIAAPYVPPQGRGAIVDNAYFAIDASLPGATRLVPKPTAFGREWQAAVVALLTSYAALRAYLPLTPYQAATLFADDGMHVGDTAEADGRGARALLGAMAAYLASPPTGGDDQWVTARTNLGPLLAAADNGAALANLLALATTFAPYPFGNNSALAVVQGDVGRLAGGDAFPQDRAAIEALRAQAQAAAPLTDPPFPAPTAASAVDNYLEQAFAIARVRDLFDASAMGQDLQFVDDDTVVGLGVGGMFAAVCTAAAVLLLLRTRVSFGGGIIDDYFRTSLLSKQPTALYNPVVIAVVALCLLFWVYRAYDTYLVEAALLRMTAPGTKSLWPGRRTVAPLVFALAACAAWVPVYYKMAGERRLAVVVTLTMVAMLFTPLVWVMKGLPVGAKSDRLRQFNAYSIVFVLAAMLVVVTTDARSPWRTSLIVLALTVAAVFTSLPAGLWDPTGMTDEEYSGKLKQANYGALAGIAAYCVLIFAYVALMRRERLFPNALGRALPVSKAFNLVA